MGTELEDLLFLHIKASGLPEPEREQLFIKGRKFRADFLWRKERVIAEVNGGTFRRMAHSTGEGIHRDYEKGDLATLAGWRYFNFDRSMIEDGFAIETLKKAFNVPN
jgi:very-short-patch-repair endonuclease